MIKKILLALLIVFVIIQFIRPKHNTGEVTAQDITRAYVVPDSVHAILAKACLDCHSNNTRYPWYNDLAPVSWFLNGHIQEAKEDLNFSEFAAFPKKRQAKKLAKVAKSVDEGWMPLDSYLWIHKDAVLTPQEKALVSNWATALSKQIAETNHIDMTPEKKEED